MDRLYLYEAALRLGISCSDLIKHIENGDIPISQMTYTAKTHPPKPTDKISLSAIQYFENNHNFNRIHKPVIWKTNAHGCHVCISHPCDSQGYPVLTINGKQKPIAQYLYEMAHQRTGGLYLNRPVKHACGNVKCISLACIGIKIGKRRSQRKQSPSTCINEDNDILQIGFFTGRRIASPGAITIARIRAIRAEKNSGKSASEVAQKYQTSAKVVSQIWKDTDQSSKGLS